MVCVALRGGARRPPEAEVDALGYQPFLGRPPRDCWYPVTLVSFDPGVSNLAWAYWGNMQLKSAGFIEFHGDRTKAIMELLDNLLASHAVIEMPQVYQGHKNTKGADAQDILNVVRTVGVCEGLLERSGVHVAMVAPGTWKGQAPKSVIQGRIMVELSPGEASNLPTDIPLSKMHNVWDAIGIGLWYQRRLAR